MELFYKKGKRLMAAVLLLVMLLGVCPAGLTALAGILPVRLSGGKTLIQSASYFEDYELEEDNDFTVEVQQKL